MRRGDLVTIALQGDYGKPRPALVIQADPFAGTASVTVLLVTAMLTEAPLLRLTIDKAMTVRADRIGAPFGHLDDAAMVAVNRSLALFLGLAG